MNQRSKSKKRKNRREKVKSKQRRLDARVEAEKIQAKAPYIKSILRNRGCDLPFYDYLDSYREEFERTARQAISEHDSLMGVYEVDDAVYSNPERDWGQFGHGELEQIYFDIGEEFADYGKSLGKQANLCGCMSVFLDSEGEVKTLILIRRSVPGTSVSSDQKYAFKIAALLHEIGHVTDVENAINFEIDCRRFDVVEAEVYANLYCLDRLAERSLVVSYSMLHDALQDAANRSGYMASIGAEVIRRVRDYSFTDWNVFMDQPMTEPEAKLIGAAGVRAMSE